MPTIKILRIVDSKGFGLYRPFEGLSLANYVFNTDPNGIDHYNHPLPSEDSDLFFYTGYSIENTKYANYKFAFLNKRQFLRWVYNPQWRKDMDDLEARLLVITVDCNDYIEGNYQVMYNPEKVIDTKSFKVSSFDCPILTKELEEYLR